MLLIDSTGLFTLWARLLDLNINVFAMFFNVVTIQCNGECEMSYLWLIERMEEKYMRNV